jgi:NitT/TauT family transport system substrate-binding protein
MRKFLFAKGFLGAEAKSADHFGISFPDGSVLGNPKNIRLVYTTKFMEGAKK